MEKEQLANRNTMNKPQQCIRCSSSMHTIPATSGNIIKKGQIAVCNCGQVYIVDRVDNELKLHPITQNEFDALSRTNPNFYQKIIEGQKILAAQNKMNCVRCASPLPQKSIGQKTPTTVADIYICGCGQFYRVDKDQNLALLSINDVDIFAKEQPTIYRECVRSLMTMATKKNEN